jgi:SAM-dependent methyltransferase
MLDALDTKDWSQGYVHDLPYSDHFYPELAPALLNYVAALNGCRPQPLDRPFTYCELGCGNGQTVTVLAAANPNGSFYGCDFNPSHIATAQRWAEAGEVGNLALLERSFEQLSDAEIPDLDFIALHGVYSWISPISRRAILAFIQRKLKPGGFVYVSYNCLPGWATAAPLQRLMVELAISTNGDTVEKVEAATALLKRLKEIDTGFVKNNVGASAFLDRVAAATPNYLAHEYLNRSWTLFYFADVARELAAVKLSFVGSATTVDNHPQLLMGKEALAVLAEEQSRERRQLVQDFLINQRFRRDIFVKGHRSLSPAKIQREVSALAVGLLKPASEVSYEGRSLGGTFKFDTKAAHAVIERLADGPQTIGDLSGNPNGEALPSAELLRAIHDLIAARQIAPFATAPTGRPTVGSPTRYALAAAYNRAIVVAAWEEEDRATLASPIAGTGIRLDPVERSLLNTLCAVGADRVAAAMWDEAEKRGVRLLRAENTLDTREENMSELQSRWANFRETRLPLLTSLGILRVA